MFPVRWWFLPALLLQVQCVGPTPGLFCDEQACRQRLQAEIGTPFAVGACEQPIETLEAWKTAGRVLQFEQSCGCYLARNPGIGGHFRRLNTTKVRENRRAFVRLMQDPACNRNRCEKQRFQFFGRSTREQISHVRTEGEDRRPASGRTLEDYVRRQQVLQYARECRCRLAGLPDLHKAFAGLDVPRLEQGQTVWKKQNPLLTALWERREKQRPFVENYCRFEECRQLVRQTNGNVIRFYRRRSLEKECPRGLRYAHRYFGDFLQEGCVNYVATRGRFRPVARAGRLDKVWAGKVRYYRWDDAGKFFLTRSGFFDNGYMTGRVIDWVTVAGKRLKWKELTYRRGLLWGQAVQYDLKTRKASEPWFYHPARGVKRLSRYQFERLSRQPVVAQPGQRCFGGEGAECLRLGQKALRQENFLLSEIYLSMGCRHGMAGACRLNGSRAARQKEHRLAGRRRNFTLSALGSYIGVRLATALCRAPATSIS